MKMFTAAHVKALLKNHGKELSEMKPVAKLFCPWGAATWLICEMDPQDNDIVYAICDLGLDCVEYGTVSMRELQNLRGPFGLKIERDLHWTASKTASEYYNEGCEQGRLAA
jgi:hypothetical protein